MFTNQSPKRTNIEEANKHLQLLHNKVGELENQLKEKQKEAENLDSQVEERLQSITQEKDAHIKELNQRIKTLESRVHVSQIVIKENEHTISALEKKAKKYEEFCHFAPVLKNLLSLLEREGNHGMSNGIAASNVSSLHLPVISTPESSSLSSHPPSSSSGSTSTSTAKRYARPQVDGSPTIEQMTQRFASANNRHFSISEDELDDLPQPSEILAKVKQEKELYL